MIPIALTIAGSDSGGGAGIQADLKTFLAFGVHGTSVLTALTAQSTRGVFGVHAVPPEFVRRQLDVVVEDLRPAACKTGMLATAELVREVAEGLRRHALTNFVLDPVMVASSGDRLLDPDAEEAIARLLLPLSTLVTPNLEEAAILAETVLEDEAGMRRAAERLVTRGARAVLVKGGHLRGEVLTDVFFDGIDFRSWSRRRIETRSTHGTGCTLSAAVAAGLALGLPLLDALEDALDFVHRAIESAPGLGAGHGPLNHSTTPRRR
jgi:hydroxymethylpyrimidine/phosphomethylpyrimidine kinase